MFKQVELKYPYNALEPYIDELTMITHYTKHYANYTNNFNEALEKLPELSGMTVEEILSNLEIIEDEQLREAVRRNGGGYYNHSLYFTIISPHGGGAPSGRLGTQINKDFGSYQKFQQDFYAAAMSVFGSGYAWLSADPSGNLSISTTPNQDNPLMKESENWTPILTVDVWEHAYYLKYKNLRTDYVKAFFNIIDWGEVAKIYEKVIV